MLKYITHNRHKPKTAFAQTLRKRQTPGEIALWRKLRAKRFHHLKFRRQAPIGPYIVDFLCVEKRLIIEIDGISHLEPGAEAYDIEREEYLKSEGFRVIRFSNGQTVNHLYGVLSKIEKALNIDR